MKIRKFALLILSLVIMLGLSTDAFAASNSRYSGQCFDICSQPILNQADIDDLSAKLDSLAQKHNLNMIIVVSDNLEGKGAVAYADDIYDEVYGTNTDGVLFLLNKSSEDQDGYKRYISTSGKGIEAFTDAGIQYIGKQIKPIFEEDKDYEAFNEYIKLADDFLTQQEAGKPYDKRNLPRTAKDILKEIGIALVAGLIIGLIVVFSFKSQLKSVAMQHGAANYTREGSMNITNSRDIFLYHHVSKTAKPKSDGGGSSTHTSSSGGTHGGGGF